MICRKWFRGWGNNLGLTINIQHIENPRIEADEHYYNPKHTGMSELGLKPNYLTDEVLEQMIVFVLKHKSKIIVDQIYPEVKWA